MSTCRPHDPEDVPLISAIVPVYNGASYLSASLTGIQQSMDRVGGDILVVDDASTDGSGDIARAFGIKVIRMESRVGAARARNIGVEHVEGSTLAFIDSDVVPHPDALQKLLVHLDHEGYAAAFGSYDTACRERNFFSRYQNLRHCFYHQRGNPEAESFWCGLGVVKRQALSEVGGFDPKYEGIEDVELGARLRAAGYRIRLDSACLGTHLKAWSLWSALRTDIVKRALPWSRLLCGEQASQATLNTSWAERLRAVAALLFILSTILATLNQVPWIFPVLLGLLVGAANYRFAAFLSEHAGIFFAVPAVIYHQVYYGYGAITYVYCLCESWLARGLRALLRPESTSKRASPH